MQSNVIVAIAAVVIIAAAGVGVFMLTNDDKDKTDGDVTDALDRQVKIPANLDNGIVTIGNAGPLRYASMFDIADKVIEVDKGDITDNKNGRAYSYAYPYDKMSVDTQSHPDGALEAATVESIAKKEPSLIITNVSKWNQAAANFEILEKSCTIVVLKDQEMKFMTGDDGKLADYNTFNINLLGKVFKMEDRAKEIIDGINGIITDIASLKGPSDKKIYVAGVTISGSNQLTTTFPNYIPFDLTGSINAYTGDKSPNKVDLTVETFSNMAMDMIIIDPSSADKIGETNSQGAMNYLYGLGASAPKMYITVPIVWDSINYDCALASAYVVNYLNYGTLNEAQLTAKINNIFTVFYGDHGANVLTDMKTFFTGKCDDNGQVMPLFKEVTIQQVGETYKFVEA
ncbi:MAG: ABC transporter substrate-binding protein [Candidatus Methanomethylophilaceae archaeon]|nr:ABC transporter substrate-binding protein [Candidatus Methanomethylophilaceae archaeon]